MKDSFRSIHYEEHLTRISIRIKMYDVVFLLLLSRFQNHRSHHHRTRADDRPRLKPIDENLAQICQDFSFIFFYQLQNNCDFSFSLYIVYVFLLLLFFRLQIFHYNFKNHSTFFHLFSLSLARRKVK